MSKIWLRIRIAIFFYCLYALAMTPFSIAFLLETVPFLPVQVLLLPIGMSLALYYVMARLTWSAAKTVIATR